MTLKSFALWSLTRQKGCYFSYLTIKPLSFVLNMKLLKLLASCFETRYEALEDITVYVSGENLWYLTAPVLFTYHAAGVSRRQVHNVTKCPKNVTKCPKNVSILEFHDHIWNHYEKCIQMSTNMPGIGSWIREIDVKMPKFEKANRLLLRQ